MLTLGVFIASVVVVCNVVVSADIHLQLNLDSESDYQVYVSMVQIAHMRFSVKEINFAVYHGTTEMKPLVSVSLTISPNFFYF